MLRPRIKPTHEIPNPSYYVTALDGEFRDWAFNEERAPTFRGLWREEIFGVSSDHPLDLEVGTGNGFFFAHQAASHPDRCLVGIERKYKPLIQSIRRARREGSENARIVRYDAAFLFDLFNEQELNNVFIHFPDPWEKERQKKHRLINDQFLEGLFQRQKPGSFIEFKTDSRDYFDEAVQVFERSTYQVECLTYDLHQSPYASSNFVTHFESLFLRQKLPIHLMRLKV